jgi:hypothetical protein
LPDNLILNVRQIAQYAARTIVDPSDLILVQIGGLGGAYGAATAESVLATTGFNPSGPFVWGVGPPPADAAAAQVMSHTFVLPLQSSVLFNTYDTATGGAYWQNGPAGLFGMQSDGRFDWDTVASGAAGAAIPAWQGVMSLTPAGHLTLFLDTISVARDPTAPLEVATMQYVTNHTVASFNGRTGAVTLTLADVTGAGGAPAFSPTFAGVPNAPTAAPGTNTTQLATTQFVQAAIAAVSPDVHSFNGRSGVVTFLTADFNAATAVLTDPAPTAPTQPLTDSSTNLATTAFVTGWAATNGVTSFNTRHGAITLTGADLTAAGGALLASPAFSGTPTAPTANPGTSTGQLATTAFVQAAIVAATTGVASWNGRTGAVVLNQSDIVNAAGWASPALTGTPTAPTAATATNTTQLATTAFVHAAITAGAPGVTTFNTRSGAVVLTTADVTGVGGAPLNAPAFTGVATANTAAPGTNTTQLATTAFVAAALAAISTGVTSFNSRTGPVVLQGNDVSAAGGALVASPAFTGTPTAPTATTGDSSFALATTQFVAEAIAANISGVSTWNGRAGAVTMVVGDITAAGGAPVASPALTGVPLAPTAAPGISTTQIATTAFVASAVAGFVPVLAIKIFASNGTYTPTPGMTCCVIECVGGGAGGNGAPGNPTFFVFGGGGGSGAYARKLATAASVGVSKVVTIGTGGVGGGGGTVGGLGTDTSVGALCLAKGAPAAPSVYVGGDGGPATGSVGDLIIVGNSGANGGYITQSTTAITTGAGGNSFFGPGGPASAWTATTITGANARGPGGGGAGGSIGQSGGVGGGTGAPGVVVITEFA